MAHIATILNTEIEFDLQFACSKRGICIDVNGIECGKSHASFKHFQESPIWRYLGQGTVHSYNGEKRKQIEHSHFFKRVK